MSEMIERVTKAVRNAREMSLCSLCDSRMIRCSCAEIARAAIEAMREPDTGMLRGLLIHRGYDPDAKEETLDKLGQLDIATMGTFVSAYRAMISAALSQDTHSLPSEDR